MEKLFTKILFKRFQHEAPISCDCDNLWEGLKVYIEEVIN